MPVSTNLRFFKIGEDEDLQESYEGSRHVFHSTPVSQTPTNRVCDPVTQSLEFILAFLKPSRDHETTFSLCERFRREFFRKRPISRAVTQPWICQVSVHRTGRSSHQLNVYHKSVDLLSSFRKQSTEVRRINSPM